MNYAIDNFPNEYKEEVAKVCRLCQQYWENSRKRDKAISRTTGLPRKIGDTFPIKVLGNGKFEIDGIIRDQNEENIVMAFWGAI